MSLDIKITVDPETLKELVKQHLVSQGFKNPKVITVLTGTRLQGYGPMEHETVYFDGMVCSVDPPAKQ